MQAPQLRVQDSSPMARWVDAAGLQEQRRWTVDPNYQIKTSINWPDPNKGFEKRFGRLRNEFDFLSGFHQWFRDPWFLIKLLI